MFMDKLATLAAGSGDKANIVFGFQQKVAPMANKQSIDWRHFSRAHGQLGSGESESAD